MLTPQKMIFFALEWFNLFNEILTEGCYDVCNTTRPEIIKYSDLSYFIIFRGQAQVVLCKGNSRKTKRSKKKSIHTYFTVAQSLILYQRKRSFIFSFSSHIKYIHLKIILLFDSWKYEKSWLAKHLCDLIPFFINFTWKKI